MGDRTGKPNKNKTYILNKLKDIYGEEFDPVMRMAEMATLLQARAMDAEADDTKVIKDAIDGWDKIAKYVTPALKAQEVSFSQAEGDEGQPLIKVEFVKANGNKS